MSVSRTEIEKNIIERAMKDPGFREKLISDPKGALEEELGGKLPDDIKIHVNEEDADNIHITLPYGAGELTENELSGVSGGWSQPGGDGGSCMPYSSTN